MCVCVCTRTVETLNSSTGLSACCNSSQTKFYKLYLVRATDLLHMLLIGIENIVFDDSGNVSCVDFCVALSL